METKQDGHAHELEQKLVFPLHDTIWKRNISHDVKQWMKTIPSGSVALSDTFFEEGRQMIDRCMSSLMPLAIYYSTFAHSKDKHIPDTLQHVFHAQLPHIYEALERVHYLDMNFQLLEYARKQSVSGGLEDLSADKIQQIKKEFKSMPFPEVTSTYQIFNRILVFDHGLYAIQYDNMCKLFRTHHGHTYEWALPDVETEVVSLDEPKAHDKDKEIITDMAFSPDGNIFCIASASRIGGGTTLTLYYTISGAKANQITVPGPGKKFHMLRYSPNGKYLMCVQNKDYVCFQMHGSDVQGIAVAHLPHSIEAGNGDILFSSARTCEEEFLAVFCTLGMAAMEEHTPLHEIMLYKGQLDPNGKYCLFTLQSQVKTRLTSPVFRFMATKDTIKLIAANGSHGSGAHLHCWDVNLSDPRLSGIPKHIIHPADHEVKTTHPNNHIVASDIDRTQRFLVFVTIDRCEVVDLHTMEHVKSFALHHRPVTCAFLPSLDILLILKTLSLQERVVLIKW